MQQLSSRDSSHFLKIRLCTTTNCSKIKIEMTNGQMHLQLQKKTTSILRRAKVTYMLLHQICNRSVYEQKNQKKQQTHNQYRIMLVRMKIHRFDSACVMRSNINTHCLEQENLKGLFRIVLKKVFVQLNAQSGS